MTASRLIYAASCAQWPAAAAGLLHGYRPPYWLPRHQALCRIPAHDPMA